MAQRADNSPPNDGRFSYMSGVWGSPDDPEVIRACEFNRKIGEWLDAPEGAPFPFSKEAVEAREEEEKAEED